MDRDAVQPGVDPARGALALHVGVAQPGRRHRAQRGLAALLDRLGEDNDCSCIFCGVLTCDGQILGWAGFVKVDGTAYNFLGNPGVPSVAFQKSVQKSMTVRRALRAVQRMAQELTVRGIQFTATQSTFVMTSGPVDLTVTFLSPVEVRRSHPRRAPRAFSRRAPPARPADGPRAAVAAVLVPRRVCEGERRQDAQRAGVHGHQRGVGHGRQQPHGELEHDDDGGELAGAPGAAREADAVWRGQRPHSAYDDAFPSLGEKRLLMHNVCPTEGSAFYAVQNVSTSPIESPTGL